MGPTGSGKSTIAHLLCRFYDATSGEILIDGVPVEVEQSLIGRALGYGTVVAGDLEIPHVPQPRDVYRLLAVDGIRFVFSSFVNNFAGFAVVAVTFVAMAGVGVAEKAGLMAALVRLALRS